MARFAAVGLVASGISFIGSILTLFLGLGFFFLVLTNMSLTWDECTVVGNGGRRLSSIHPALALVSDAYDFDDEEDDPELYASEDYWDFDEDEGEYESVSDPQDRRLYEVEYDTAYACTTGKGKGDYVGKGDYAGKGGCDGDDGGNGGNGDDGGNGGNGGSDGDDVGGKSDGDGDKGHGGTRSVYTKEGDGSCNWHWRSVFSFVPPIFLILWLPLIMGYLGMATQLEDMKINGIIDAIVPESYIGYGVLMAITAVFANLGYCGKIGVILGFYNALAAVLCFIARVFGLKSVAGVAGCLKKS